MKLVNGLSDSAVLSAGGIHLGGEKYIYLRSDDNQIQGRKGDGGCSVAKANTCKYWQGRLSSSRFCQPGGGLARCDRQSVFWHTSLRYLVLHLANK